MQISSLLGLVLGLGACSPSQSLVPAVADGGEHVDCALAGAAQFTPSCAAERAERDGTLVLTVRHPDGGFRRFDVLKDGHGLATSDGAELAQVALDGQMLAVSVGPDRYRFPVTLAPSPAAR